MKKFVFFVCTVLCSTGLIAMNSHVNYNIIELSDGDDDVMTQASSTDEENYEMTDEEIHEMIVHYIEQRNPPRYETLVVIGQGEGPDALNPVNHDSSNRSRASSFTDQMAMYHNQTVEQNPIVIFEDQEAQQDQQMQEDEIGFHDYGYQQEFYDHGNQEDQDNETGWNDNYHYNYGSDNDMRE